MTSAHGSSPTARVPDASMSLLNDVARMPLEPAYRTVAVEAHRAAFNTIVPTSHRIQLGAS